MVPVPGLIRRFRPHFRPPAPRFEVQQGFEVHRPKFLCFPGVLKRTDGLFMALSLLRLARRLVRDRGLTVIDAHFGYPEGRAATLLGRWMRLPVMVTLRGKEERQLRTDVAGPLTSAIRSADRLVTVSEALRKVALDAGALPERAIVIGNGVDTEKFHPIDRQQARRELGLPPDARVLISVGGLVERKGLHRVIDCLPALRGEFPDLRYLVVGGPGPEGGHLGSPAVPGRAQLGLADRGALRSDRCRRRGCTSPTRPPTSSCSLRVTKAGRTSFSRRWPAACRS